MRTAFHDATFVQHQNLICITNRRQTVRNRNRSARCHQAFKRLLHQAFTLRVQCTCRFIENQNIGILQNGACNRDALSLSPRKFSTAVTHIRVVSLGSSHNEFVCVSHFRCFNHLFQRSIFHPKSNVVEERIVEENRLLVHIANERAQVRQTQLTHIRAIDGDASAHHIVIAWHQIHQRTLTASTLSHEGYRLTTFHREIHPANHHFLLRYFHRRVCSSLTISKGHILKRYTVGEMTYRHRIFWFANGIFCQEYFIDALHRSHTFGNRIGSARQIFQRLNHAVKNHHIEDKSRRIDGTVVSKNQRTAIPKH